VKAYFGKRKTYFGKKRSIFGAHALGGRKEACRKRMKKNMQEEKQCGAHVDMPNHVRGRVFDNMVTTISQ
jgi:hypothetical protein